MLLCLFTIAGSLEFDIDRLNAIALRSEKVLSFAAVWNNRWSRMARSAGNIFDLYVLTHINVHTHINAYTYVYIHTHTHTYRVIIFGFSFTCVAVALSAS